MANVLRVNRDLGPTAAAGVFGSTRSLPSGRNSVTGIDGRLRFGAWSASAQAAGSFSRTPQAPDRSGFATRATLLRTGRAFNYSGEYSERSSDFESVLGYIDRVDFRRTDHRASHRFFKENSTFIDWGPDLAVSVVRDRQGRALEHQARASLMLEWSRQTQVSFYRQDAAARLRRSEFPLFDPLVEISPSYSQDGWGATFHSTPINGIEVTLGASRLDGINLVPAPGKAEGAARDASWNAQIDLRPTARLGLVVSGIETRLDTPGGDAIFVNRILRTKAQFQFSRALSARVILQYDALDAAPARTRLQSGRRFNADFLATFLPSPGTAIYAGFNNNAIDLDHALQSDRAGLAIPRGGFLSDGRQFFVKVSYLLRR